MKLGKEVYVSFDEKPLSMWLRFTRSWDFNLPFEVLYNVGIFKIDYLEDLR